MREGENGAAMTTEKTRWGSGRWIGDHSLGFGLSLFLGGLGLWATFGEFSVAGKYCAFILVPFVIGFIATGRIGAAFVFVWINEMFFGGADSWSHIGFVPIRWLLLLVLGILGIIEMAVNRRRLTRWEVGIIFYGATLPMVLVGYSVLVRNNDPSLAIADSSVYFSVLAFFAIRRLIFSRAEMLYGWLKGTATIVAVLSLVFILGPTGTYERCFALLAGKDYVCGTTEAGFNRAIFLPQVILFYGIFRAILSLLCGRRGKATLGSVIAFCVCSGPFVLTYSRGALLAVGLGTMLILGLVGMRVWRVFLFATLIAGLGISALWLYREYLPEAYIKFTKVNLPEDNLRMEQMRYMWDAFLEHPVFGAGVGNTLDDYRRDAHAGLAFEMQYSMLLWRLGIVFSGIVIVAPLCGLIWLVKRDWKYRRNGGARSKAGAIIWEEKVAISAALIAVLVEGAFNPFLVSVYTGLYVCLVLGEEDWFMKRRGWREWEMTGVRRRDLKDLRAVG